MGNRAVITTAHGWLCQENNLGVYLHWNGGRDSVEAFLKYCKLHGYSSPEHGYNGWVALATVISNFFGVDGRSIEIDIVRRLDCDNGDNGVYIIADWEIVNRHHFKGFEQRHHDLAEFLVEIDKKMPEGAQLGEDFLNASIVPTEEIKIGDMVFVQNIDGTYEKCEVVGIGIDEWVNGTKVNGIPYVNKYGAGDHSHNINNYLRTPKVRVFKPKETEVEQ